MAIKLKPRATVDEEFMELYKQAAGTKLRFQMNKLQSMSKNMAKESMGRNRSMYGRLTAIVKGIEEPGKGLDFEKARLHALDFEKFWVCKHGAETYFVATTRDVVIDQITKKNVLQCQWDAGPYSIYVPLKGLMSLSSNTIHVVPERKPMTTRRHPHHTASGAPVSFLDMNPSTCWSEFGAPIMASINELNLVELFRFMRIFVGRYYSGSPLSNPEYYHQEMDFMRRL